MDNYESERESPLTTLGGRTYPEPLRERTLKGEPLKVLMGRYPLAILKGRLIKIPLRDGPVGAY